MGTAYKALLPYQTFATKTRDLALAVGSEKLWRIFCPLIGLPGLATDPRYSTNRARDEHRASLVAILQEVFLTKTYEEWESLLVANGIPVGQVNNLAEVVQHAQVVARGSFVEMDHPKAGKVRVVGVPARLSRTPGDVRSPSPSLGEHTDEALRELLGLDAKAIAALRASGALGAA
jgi:crotonobetainyl-CoA:carnitine CoA-transferase CaiB-like acyl-CoA transferase